MWSRLSNLLKPKKDEPRVETAPDFPTFEPAAPPPGDRGPYISLGSRPGTEARGVATAPPGPPPQKPPARKVVNPPVLADESEVSSWSEEIRIRARPEGRGASVVFLVDRPVFEGRSAWFPTAASAEESPLATALFGVSGVESVMLHDTTVTATLSPALAASWEAPAGEIGAILRTHLKEGIPVVSETYRNRIPSEAEIRERVQTVIDAEINPGIAAHSGVISLVGVEGNTVTISMGGGCQGCAASTITLKEGIHKAFRQAVPELGAILDETDHGAGKNPYFKELPEWMKADAAT